MAPRPRTATVPMRAACEVAVISTPLIPVLPASLCIPTSWVVAFGCVEQLDKDAAASHRSTCTLFMHHTAGAM